MNTDPPLPTGPNRAPAWLVLLYQVPSRSSSIRVRIWRRLQAIGAVQIRQAAYLLPNREQTREDMEWLKTEIAGLGGQATVLVADATDAFAHDEIVGAFRAARARDVAALAKRGQRLLKHLDRKGPVPPQSPVARTARSVVETWQALANTTFFDTPGTAEMEAIVSQLAQASRPSKKVGGKGEAQARPLSRAAYRKRRWVTRPRPGVDRMASAWLIRTFVDPEATFEFRDDAPTGAVAFDMFGVEFGHQGDACTFEVLRARFGLADPAVDWIARVVHDLDLREHRHNEPEAPGIGLMIEGLRRAHADDRELLDRGIALFASLAMGHSASAGKSPRRRRSSNRVTSVAPKPTRVPRPRR